MVLPEQGGRWSQGAAVAAGLVLRLVGGETPWWQNDRIYTDNVFY